MERALAIRTKKLGENHPDTLSTRNNLDAVRKKIRAQLGRRIRKPQVPRIARRPDTFQNSLVPVAGVKPRSKQLPSHRSPRTRERDSGSLGKIASSVTGHQISSSRPPRLRFETVTVFLVYGNDISSTVLFRFFALNRAYHTGFVRIGTIL